MARESSRRQFFKITAGGMLGLYFGSRWMGSHLLRRRRIPGGTLDPARACPSFNAHAHPARHAEGGTIKMKGGKNADYYEISMRQFRQQILPAGLPATTVWGYGAVKADSKQGLLLHNAPSLTIEATNRPVRVKWVNELVDANGNYLPHLLPVDPTLHWANPPGGGGADTRPTFTSTPVRTPARCRWSRTCTEQSAWATRATVTPRRGTSRCRQYPGGICHQGTWYDFFAGKAAANSARPGDQASPPSSTPTRTAPPPSGITTTASG